MKIGVSSYSFSRLVNSGAMKQLDVIAKAKEMGFDVIEFSTFILPEGETPLTFAPKVKEECERVRIEIANYTISGDLLNGSDGNLDDEVERLKGEGCADPGKPWNAPRCRMGFSGNLQGSPQL